MSFEEKLRNYFSEFKRTLATGKGDWTVKGFIDVYKNIYTISVDTKVISKIVELMLFPVISKFAKDNNYQMCLSEHQNHYPDITFISKNEKIAVDLKSTYRINDDSVNGFTLGAFTGYFRQRTSTKNITYAYQEYSKHIILGIIYSRTENIDERQIYHFDNLANIVSVAKDFDFLVQEKWKIASDKPGSGNTKNIGSHKDIKTLISGNGTFAKYGIKTFDDYWMNYLTEEMAKNIDSEVPYHNLEQYLKWRGR